MTEFLPALREELQRLKDELAMDPRHAQIARIRALLETYPESTSTPPSVRHRPAPPVFWKPEEDDIIASLVKRGRHSDIDIKALLPQLPGRNAAQIDGRIRRLRVKAKRRPRQLRRFEDELVASAPMSQQMTDPDPPVRTYIGMPETPPNPPTAPDTEKEVMPHLLPATDAISVRPGHDDATAPAVAGAEPPANLAELEARYTTDPIYERREQPAAMGAYLSGGFEALKLGGRR